MMAGTVDKGASEAAGASPDSLEEVLDRLEQEHESVVRREIPRLQNMLHAADAAQGARFGGVFRALNEELARLWFDVEQHLRQEEEALFPFVRELERSAGQGEQGCGGALAALDSLGHEHENARDRLERIRRLTANYDLPQGAGRRLAELYAGLEALEDALKRHFEVEDDVLIPRAMALAQRPRRD